MTRAVAPVAPVAAGGWSTPTMVYDDVSVFVRAFGGVYLQFGVQDRVLRSQGGGADQGDRIEPLPGGRGLVPNHHPAFYADDDALVTSLRIHAHVAVDHLAGRITGPAGEA